MDDRSFVWQCAEFSIRTGLQPLRGPWNYPSLSLPYNIMQRTTAIASNPWFRRAWVVQEVASHPITTLRINNQETEWETFRSLLWATNAIKLRLIRATKAVEGLDTAIHDPQASSLWLSVAPGSRCRKSLSIFSILACTHDFYATDPRDKIFALYHLADDVPPQSFIPDYAKTVTEVFSQFTRWIIDNTGSLRILCFADQVLPVTRQEQLPSWVPDYQNLAGHIKDFWNYENQNFRVSHRMRVAQRYVGNRAILSVQGCHLARVKGVIRIESQSWEAIRVCDIWALLCRVHSENYSATPSAAKYLEDAIAPALTRSIFAHVLLHGDDSYTAMKLLTDLLAREDPDLARLNCSWSDQHKLHRLMRIPTCEPFFAQQKMLLHTGRQAFFFCNRGKLGLCPMGTRVGDSIVTLYGGDGPFVLRPKPKSPRASLAQKLKQRITYEFVGECYLGGMMQGEQERSPYWSDSLHADPLDPDPCLDPQGMYYQRGVYRTEFFDIE
ncbi:hypothetical protein LTS15_011271 [Exophiala xenobiotica]|nr:hypothetical protein LTS15_011271 [Exophiala xenobiotica]